MRWRHSSGMGKDGLLSQPFCPANCPADFRISRLSFCPWQGEICLAVCCGTQDIQVLRLNKDTENTRMSLKSHSRSKDASVYAREQREHREMRWSARQEWSLREGVRNVKKWFCHEWITLVFRVPAWTRRDRVNGRRMDPFCVYVLTGGWMSVDFRLVINFHSCLFSVSNNMICWFVVTLSSGRTDGGRAGFVGSW
jgi:hypothetical protein